MSLMPRKSQGRRERRKEAGAKIGERSDLEKVFADRTGSLFFDDSSIGCEHEGKLPDAGRVLSPPIPDVQQSGLLLHLQLCYPGNKLSRWQ